MAKANEDFEGRTVSGDVSHYTEGFAEQADPRQFLAALDALLATPGVEAVQWQQYTPYFNDGEACEFGTGECMIKLAGDDEHEGDYGYGYRTGYELWDYIPGGTYRDKQDADIPGINVSLVRAALDNFEGELGPKHYVVLNQKFGDPATVTATTEGFEVEFYEHD